MPSPTEIAWAAGFIEGEGWIGKVGASIAIRVSQVSLEPLLKLRDIFGGRITGPIRRTPYNPKWQPYFLWQSNGHAAAGIAMTLYIFMSQRRREAIRRCLNIWKTNRMAPGLRQTCPAGHPYSGFNLVLINKGGRPKQARLCRICLAASQKKYHDRVRKEAKSAFAN